MYKFRPNMALTGSWALLFIALSTAAFYGCSYFAHFSTLPGSDPIYGILTIQLASIGIFLLLISVLFGCGFMIIRESDFDDPLDYAPPHEKMYYDYERIYDQFESSRITIHPLDEYHNPLLNSSSDDE